MGNAKINAVSNGLKGFFYPLLLGVTGGLGALPMGLIEGGNAAIDKLHKSQAEKVTQLADMAKWLKTNYPNLTDAQIDDLLNQYGGHEQDYHFLQDWFNFNELFDRADFDSLTDLLNDIEAAHELYGDAPTPLTEEELNKIEQDAYAEIAAKDQEILDLYDQSFNTQKNFLENSLKENSAAFTDYRNQMLTSNAMNQQMLAGSTRFELERQQRNAIIRGASAAQRLVANINTQLGMQSKSAQLSLDTSNALAQQLLLHRQAQQGVRSDYMNAQTQYTNNKAGVLQDQLERQRNYGRSKRNDAINDYQTNYQLWEDNLNNSGLGNTGIGIYRSQYGSRKNRTEERNENSY